MTVKLPLTTGDLSRRSLMRKGMLTGLGVAALSIAAPTAAMAAQRGSRRTLKTGGRTSPTGAHPETGLTFQSNWWFCTKCKGLFYSSNGSNNGACPKDALAHTPGSTNYGVPYGNPSQAGLQVGWRYCKACATLFYGPDEAASFCPGTYEFASPHTAGDTIYDMMLTNYWSGQLQSGWSYCDQCQGLFWGTDASTSHCPDKKYTNHHVSATDYCLID